MNEILALFPDLSDQQKQQFAQLADLYRYWNERINLISRNDIQYLYEKHILHSLSIGKIVPFEPRQKILDIGTGGGFPGIPLAILFPQNHFHLVDSIGKKIMVVNDIAQQLSLKNVQVSQERAENLRGKYHWICARAVAPISTLCQWTNHLLYQPKNGRGGWLLLKGGDLEAEILACDFPVKKYPLENVLNSEYYAEKYLLHVQYYA
ncbi:MAG: 16S rRNA (guanine(527)-N(7))-methyltransferase RsmG [Chitinophagales bacterium]|nr:16S rRNA (guanine(527)-N(7))-methyltransferase RsmG [Bacteroidota bacterium]MCB9042739.1 16S rRNA (guanine(527)-N(7))-methyltransferase RsmG [Chitinophagales bacterium]